MRWDFEQVAGPFSFTEGPHLGWGGRAFYRHPEQPHHASHTGGR